MGDTKNRVVPARNDLELQRYLVPSCTYPLKQVSVYDINTIHHAKTLEDSVRGEWPAVHAEQPFYNSNELHGRSILLNLTNLQDCHRGDRSSRLVVKFKSYRELAACYHKSGFGINIGVMDLIDYVVYTLVSRKIPAQVYLTEPEQSPWRQWETGISTGELQPRDLYWGLRANGLYGFTANLHSSIYLTERRIMSAIHGVYRGLEKAIEESEYLFQDVQAIFCFGFERLDVSHKKGYVQHVLAKRIRDTVKRVQQKNGTFRQIHIYSHNVDFNWTDIKVINEHVVKRNIPPKTAEHYFHLRSGVSIFRDLATFHDDCIVLNLSFDHAIRDIITTIADPVAMLCHPIDPVIRPPTDMDYNYGGSSPSLVDFRKRCYTLTQLTDYKSIVNCNGSERRNVLQSKKLDRLYDPLIYFDKVDERSLEWKAFLKDQVCFGDKIFYVRMFKKNWEQESASAALAFDIDTLEVI